MFDLTNQLENLAKSLEILSNIASITSMIAGNWREIVNLLKLSEISSQRNLQISLKDIENASRKIQLKILEYLQELDRLSIAEQGNSNSLEYSARVAELLSNMSSLMQSAGSLDRASATLFGTNAGTYYNFGLSDNGDDEAQRTSNALTALILSTVSYLPDLAASSVAMVSYLKSLTSETSAIRSIVELIATVMIEDYKSKELDEDKKDLKDILSQNPSSLGDLAGGVLDLIKGGSLSTKTLGTLLSFSGISESTATTGISTGVTAIINVIESLRSTVLTSVLSINLNLTLNTGIVDTRLYGLMTETKGLNVNYVNLGNDIIDLVSETGSMALLNESDIITKMVELINLGIAFNIELRALWSEMTDKLVSTFSVTNPTLLSLVQLLQEELTDTYMGIEAAVTRTLNSMYKDTQYLNTTYDSVWSSIQDSLANVSSDVGAEIAYQILVWLGSLSSLGLGSNAATSIALSINSLLTGDTDLSETGKNLLAMAASSSGLDFGSLFVNGVSSGSEMSQLMKGIITVLQDIYTESKGNNVLLNKWGDIFSLSLSDWKAISNLTLLEITTLASFSNYTRADAINEILYIADNLVSQRTLTDERWKNLVSNATFEAGWNFATSSTAQNTYNISSYLSKFISTLSNGGATSSLNNVLGNRLSKNTTLNYISLLGALLPEATSSLISILAAQDLLHDIPGSLSGLVSENAKYANFNNTTGKSGKIGDFSSELFSYLLQDQGYIDYGNISKASFNQTTLKSIVLDSLSDFTSTNVLGSIFGTRTGLVSSGYNTNSATGTNAVASGLSTAYTGISNGYGTTSVGSTIYTGTTGQGTVGNAADNPSNTVLTIDTLYLLLSTKPGAYVTIAGIEPDVKFPEMKFNVDTSENPLASSIVSSISGVIE